MKKGILYVLFCLSISPDFAQPVCSFTASDTVGCAPLFVQFTDHSTGTPPLTHELDLLGNGLSISTTNPSYIYSQGTFHVKHIVTDGNGLKDTCYQTIHVHPSMIVDALDTTICPGACLILGQNYSTVTGGTPPYLNYYWLNSLGGLLMGGKDYYQCFFQSERLVLNVVDSKFCIAGDTSIITVTNLACPTYASSPNFENQSVNISPNPTTSQLFIQTQNFQPQTISIIDMNGRKLSEQPFTSPVDVGHLSSGVYLLELKSRVGVMRKRWVKSN